jgi:hypothetical protein
LGNAEGLGGYLDPAFIEEFENLVKPPVFGAQEAGERNVNVAEIELSC